MNPSFDLDLSKLRAEFHKKYANLPSGAREEIISVVNDKPYTWKSARLEIVVESEKGNQILKQLHELEII